MSLSDKEKKIIAAMTAANSISVINQGWTLASQQLLLEYYLSDSTYRERPIREKEKERLAAIPTLDHPNFKQLFRMEPSSYSFILEKIANEIEPKYNPINQGFSADSKFKAFLYFLGSGPSYADVSDKFKIGKSTVTDIIEAVPQAIIKVLSHYISLPKEERVKETATFYQNNLGIFNCFGYLNSIHIPIIKPGFSGDAYINKEGFPSLNVQCLIDHKNRFLDVVVGWPGSSENDTIYFNSKLSENLKMISSPLPEMVIPINQWSHILIPPYIYGSKGYTNSNHLINQFLPNQIPNDEFRNDFNLKLIQLDHQHQINLNQFKNRFGLFLKPMGNPLTRIDRHCRVIMAAFIINNILIDLNDQFDLITTAELKIPNDINNDNNNQIFSNQSISSQNINSQQDQDPENLLLNLPFLYQ